MAKHVKRMTNDCRDRDYLSSDNVIGSIIDLTVTSSPDTFLIQIRSIRHFRVNRTNVILNYLGYVVI